MKKTAIFYFSHSGNSKIVAHKLQALMQGDCFEVKGDHEYPQDYQACIELAKRELKADLRPGLNMVLPDLSAYDLILFGFPNWWSTYPMPIASLIDALDLKGKEVAAFCTHEGSGLGQSARDLERSTPHSRHLNSIAIRGSWANRAGDQLRGWVEELNQ